MTDETTTSDETTMTNETPLTTIKILQCNLRKSNAKTHSLLNDPRSEQFTALLVQEQCWVRKLKSSLMHNTSWTLIESTTKAKQHPRSAIYINKRKLASPFFEQKHLPFSDVTAVVIKTANPKPTLIINVYNPPGKEDSILTPLRQYMHQHVRNNEYHAIIMAGDFNVHHPLWNPPNYTTHEDYADELIHMMADKSMRLLIPPGTITFPGKGRTKGTAIDLVWGNEAAEESVIKCKVSKKNDHGSDHYPILTELDLRPHPENNREDTMPYNYAKTDWDALRLKVTEYLPHLIDANDTNLAPSDLDQYAMEITEAITRAIHETTPRKIICPFSKRWWNDDLTEERKAANRLRNKYRKTGNTWDKRKWRKKQNEYEKNIKAAKERTWREFVQNADERTIWTIKKYIDTVPTPTHIPTLDGDAATNEEKTTKFQTTFFPPPAAANLSDIDEENYPEAVSCNNQITMRQVETAINKLAPDKAPGPDEISNRVLKKNFNVLKYHLLALAQTSVNIGHFPTPFKITTTVVLRKPSKADYTKPNAYRPIALENTIGKVLESIVAEMLSYLTETYELLPRQHFGGRPGRTAEDAMILLSERIHKAWKHKEIYTAVFMDVAGAFNNVHHKRLIHNMRMRRIPEYLSKWATSFLKGRSTQLRFNGVTSTSIPTPAGTPQGSPLSPIFYMYYNADLLDIPRSHGDSLGFIDDIAFGVQGQTDKGNVTQLRRMLEEAEMWRHKHGAQFEKSKYLLIHFTRNKRKTSSAPINMADITIEAKEEARYLGVIFDKELRFKAHLQYVVQKGTKFALAMSNAAKSQWGAQYRYIRQLFIAVVAPRTDYGAIIWHRPNDTNSQSGKQVTELEKIQRTAMKTILGCFRTTSKAAMQVETGLIPPHLRLQSRILRNLSRIQTLPSSHPLKIWMERATAHRDKLTTIATTPTTTPITTMMSIPTTFTSNLEHLTKQFPQHTTPMETIRLHIRPPWWTPTVDIYIEPTKEAAKEYHDATISEHDTCITTACIYTDGSGIDGNIGAAAVCPATATTHYQYLGKETSYNVYAAELCAIKLATDIVRDNPEYTKCVLYTDNQAAITAIVKPGQQSGQSIILSILDAIDELQQQRPGFAMSIVWTPGHEDIPGNEQADCEAKKAAQSNGQLATPFTHSAMKSARNTAIHKSTKAKWEKEWREGKDGGQHLRAITQRPTGDSGPKLYSNITNLSRQELAWLARLRTGHCSLNKYLHRFSIADQPQCPCGNGIETVAHFLLRCRDHDEGREKLRKEVGGEGMSVEKLLGHPKFIKATLNFIKSTGRFTF